MEQNDDGFLTKEKLFSLRHHKHFPLAVFILGVVLLADLVFLNLKVLGNQLPKPFNVVANLTRENAPVVTSTKSQDICGTDCMSQINKAVSAGLSAQITPSVAPLVQSFAPSTKEFFVPLGTGVVSSNTWQTVSGMQASIDGNGYGRIKSATFEITVRIPTGNETADLELYNITAGHPVWFSDVTFNNGGTPQLLVSSPITLDPGNNLYEVQARTQLTDPAYIDQARVHIIAQ